MGCKHHPAVSSETQLLQQHMLPHFYERPVCFKPQYYIPINGFQLLWSIPTRASKICPGPDTAEGTCKQLHSIAVAVCTYQLPLARLQPANNAQHTHSNNGLCV